VLAANRFAERGRPLHLTHEAAAGHHQGGLAFEKLLAAVAGDNRASPALPNERKHEEVEVGFRFRRRAPGGSSRLTSAGAQTLLPELLACVQLAEQVRDLTAYAADHRVTIAVMGCRVNGPGETDDADLGLWCGPSTVTLKRKDEKIGSFGYADVLPRLKAELDRLIGDRPR
jgi:(E)-4-hydroxy-3-methylbut-2-enyl-diphosphate synthase